MGEGWINLAVPSVAIFGHLYFYQTAFVDAYQLVSGFQFNVLALRAEGYWGLSGFFQVVGAELARGFFGLSGLSGGFLCRGFGGRLHVRHGLVRFGLLYCGLGAFFIGFCGFHLRDFLNRGDGGFLRLSSLLLLLVLLALAALVLLASVEILGVGLL